MGGLPEIRSRQEACSYSHSTWYWKFCLPLSHGMEEPGRLQSMGSLRVGHNWATSLSLFTFMHWRRKWQPTPVVLPGESQGRGAWWAAVYGVAQSRTWLKRLSSSSSSIGKRNKWKPCWLERKNKTAPIAKWHYHIENWMLLEIIESAMSQHPRSTHNNHICVLTIYARKPKLKSLTLFIIMTRSNS